jgi:flagellar assembly protein FliH
MAITTKFRFDTCFDPPPDRDIPVVEDSTPAAPIYSEADVAQAHADGLATGLATGRAEASADLEAQQSAALDTIAATLAELTPSYYELLENSRIEVLTIARAIIAKTLPRIASENALALIESAIATVLPKLMDEPRAVIRISDTLLDQLQEAIAGIKHKSGYSGDIILLVEDDLGPADCTVEWADGGAEFHQDRIWQEIDEAMDRFISGSKQAVASHQDVQTDQTSQPEEEPHG